MCIRDRPKSSSSSRPAGRPHQRHRGPPRRAAARPARLAPRPSKPRRPGGQLPRSHRASSRWRQMKRTAMPPRGRSVPGEPGADGRTTVAESGQRPGARTPPPRRRRRLGRWAGGVVVVALAVVGYSVAGALLRPGNDTIAQRLAEWGRDHHLNWAVTRLEQAQYQLNKPKAGGSLAGGIPTAAGEHDTAKAAAVPHSPVPAPLPPFVANPAPREGKWQDVVSTKGLPAVRITYLRPDDGHTSYLAAVMWLDPKLLTGPPLVRNPPGMAAATTTRAGSRNRCARA